MSSSKRKTSRSSGSGEETETDVEAPTTKVKQIQKKNLQVQNLSHFTTRYPNQQKQQQKKDHQ